MKPLTLDEDLYDNSIHENEISSKTTTWRELFILALLMAVCAAVSLFALMHQSLRLDEAQSLWQTSHSPLTIVHIVAQDVHTPLYHLTLHFWEKLFGISVFSTRLLSLLFFVLTVPAVYLLGKDSYGKKVGLFGAAMVTASPFLSWYGSETRMYSLLVLITVINQIFFLRIFKFGKWTSWWGYALTALVGMFTHYFFAFSIITQAIFYGLYRQEFPKNTKRNIFTTFAILGILFLPWLTYVFKLGFASTTQPHLTAPTTYNLFDTVSSFVFGFQSKDFNRIMISLWPLLMLFLLLGLRKDRRSGERRKIPPQSNYFLMAGILPMIFVFFISFIKPSYLSRYLIFSIPSFYLFIGWLLNLYPVWLAKLSRAALISIMLITLAIQTVSAQTPVKEDYKDAVEYLENKTGPQDIIFVAAPFTIYPVEYYYHGQAKLQTLPEWNQYATGSLPQYSPEKLALEIAEAQKNYRNAWVLLSFDQGYNDEVKQYFDSHFQGTDRKSFSPGLNLYGYKLHYQ